MKSELIKELFQRYPGNPIITAEDIPYLANSVFNAAAIKFKDEVLLLMRIEDRRGISHFTIARSEDGITDWNIDDKPTIMPDPQNYPEEVFGIEDPRITYLPKQKEWAVTYTAYSNAGPLVSLMCTRDFKHFERKGPVMPPEDKDAALFPIQFKGRWAMLHRPVATQIRIGAHIWLSFSPDLKYWGEHGIVISAKEGGWWDANKIGLSPPPLATDEGWLIMYHGVKMTASGCIYRLGLALLDLDDPCQLIARSDEWIFSPKEVYELRGDVDKVVFPGGWIVEDDKIKLYYGGADSCIALATGKLSELLDWLKRYKK